MRHPPAHLNCAFVGQITVQAGYDFPGNDLAVSTQPSGEYCESACLLDSSCQAFTYNGNNQGKAFLCGLPKYLSPL